MTPMLISFAAFVVVAALVGLVAFVFRENNDKTIDRLDSLVGKRRRADPTADILRKTAFEGDKKSFLELLTPNLPSFRKIFEQADCHIPPSTLTGIGLVLGLLAATASSLA